MKNWLLLLALLVNGAAQAQAPHSVATFDSGFGGFFTAKEIEKRARQLEAKGYGEFSIQHYGDTRNAPYGEKSPALIASYSAAGILKAFQQGADEVFVACNTASTQFEAIKDLLREQNASYPGRIHSIIEVSVKEVMKTVSAELKQRDTVNVAILATPATVRSENYPIYLAKALGVPYVPARKTSVPQPRWFKGKEAVIDSVVTTTELKLGPVKKVVIYQLAPANWVDMIEHGASDEEKKAAVSGDLKALLAMVKEPVAFDVVGEFCTHYPVFDTMIQDTFRSLQRASAATPFVVQGPLMGALFEKNFTASHALMTAPVALPRTATPKILISGENKAATEALAAKVFPNDPAPVVEQGSF